MSTELALAKTPHAVVHDISGSDCSISVAGSPWRLPSGVDLEMVGTNLVHCDVFARDAHEHVRLGARAVDEVHLGHAIARACGTAPAGRDRAGRRGSGCGARRPRLAPAPARAARSAA